MFKKKKNEPCIDRVVIDEQVVSVADLKKQANAANRRFWALLVSIVLVASLITPYLSLAAVSVDNSDVFTGEVIPGYSMGGVSVAAYGVDINSWGIVKSNTVVASNYGIWSGARAQAASAAVSKASSGTSASISSNSNLTVEDKSAGWKSITGKSDYSALRPNGVDKQSQTTQQDNVAPYRTAADCTYWDGKTPSSGDNASANITVSLYADFVVLSKTADGHVHMVTNPDDTTTMSSNYLIGGSKTGATDSNGQEKTSGTTAIPYYISLKTIFDAFGLNSSTDTIQTLMDKMASSGQFAVDANGVKYCPVLDQVVTDNNNLLCGTSYSDLNGGTKESSNGFNPYPYSMVFSCEDNGQHVVSSIYGNDEAYVFFSPASAYAQYMALRSEYDSIVSNATEQIENQDPVTAFQLGYYLAEMSILESYLEETLPQDMTRGYVGPSETSTIMGTCEDGIGTSTLDSVSKTFGGADSPEDFQKESYATLYYDVAHPVSVYGDSNNSNQGESYCVGWTDAIMDTLSTWGYDVRSDENLKSGVMKGETKAETFKRATIFTPYEKKSTWYDSQDSSGKDQQTDENKSSYGAYTPTYYPIQQHRMPKSENTYRFQILATVPYQTLLHLISTYSLDTSVSLSYSSDTLTNLTATANASSILTNAQLVGDLAAQIGEADSSSSDSNSVGNYKWNQSIVVNPSSTNTTENGSTSNTVQYRIDQALSAYQASSLTADNVHDFCDVFRSVGGLKYETFMRYYNPLKSQGGDTDIFITRISPAKTSYMPSILFSGYTCAGYYGGGNTGSNTSSFNAETDPHGQSFDYYSTPSLGPCLASHSCSDCYYGALNYEQRGFYVKSFIQTLSDTTNTPQVEAYNKAADAANKAASYASIEGDTMKQNLKTILQACEVLAFGDIYQQTQGSSASGYTITTQSLRDYVAKAKGVSSDSQVVTDYLVGRLPWGQQSVDTLNKIPDINNWNPKYETPWVTTSALLISDSNNGLNIDNYVGLVQAKGGDTPLLLDNSLPFSMLYRQKLLSYVDLNSNGTYAWTNIEDLQNLTGVNNIMDVTAKDTNVPIIGTAIQAATTAETRQKLQSDIDEACQNMFKSLQQQTDLASLLSASMPSQMQNCLAWGDYQNASDSEAQYYNDPSDADVTVVASTSSSNNSSSSSSSGSTSGTTIRSIKDVPGYKIDNTTGALTHDSTTSTTSQNVASKTKITRGVQGSTWTSTKNLASYTISATTGRIDALTSQNGTNYPYSGLASGRLQSGTDSYALMQAHVVDYSSISSGISGDLATKTHSKVVTLSDATFSGLPDFLNILGNISALFGELGKSWVNLCAGLFNSVFFADGNSTASKKVSSTDDTRAKTSQAALSSATGSTSMLANASSFDSISQLGTPASTSTFDKQKGTLTTYSSSDTSTSSASASTLVDSWGSSVLLQRGAGATVYGFLQSLGLALVFVFMLAIAFKNFAAYTFGQSGSDAIRAQMELKVVLPRAIGAIFMIGLPPLSASSQGFQGGGYLLLQFIGSVISSISNVFANLNGTGLTSYFTNFDTSACANVGDWFCYMLAMFIIGVMLLIGAILVFLQGILLFVFYLSSPLVWAFYVWPGKDPAHENSMDTNRSKIGSVFTGGKVGNEMPLAWVKNYTSIASLSIAWALIFWLSAMLFAGTASSGSTASATSSAALRSTGSYTASSAIANAGIFDPITHGSTWANLLLATIVAVLTFFVMASLLRKCYENAGNSAITTLNSVRSTAAGFVKGKAEKKIGHEIPSSPSDLNRMVKEKIESVSDNAYNKAQARQNAYRTNPNIKPVVPKTAVGKLASATTANGVYALQAARDNAQQKKLAMVGRLQNEIKALGGMSPEAQAKFLANGITEADKEALCKLGVLAKGEDGIYALAASADLDGLGKALSAKEKKLQETLDKKDKTLSAPQSVATDPSERDELKDSLDKPLENGAILAGANNNAIAKGKTVSRSDMLAARQENAISSVDKQNVRDKSHELAAKELERNAEYQVAENAKYNSIAAEKKADNFADRVTETVKSGKIGKALYDTAEYGNLVNAAYALNDAKDFANKRFEIVSEKELETEYAKNNLSEAKKDIASRKTISDAQSNADKAADKVTRTVRSGKSGKDLHDTAEYGNLVDAAYALNDAKDSAASHKAIFTASDNANKIADKVAKTVKSGKTGKDLHNTAEYGNLVDAAYALNDAKDAAAKKSSKTPKKKNSPKVAQSTPQLADEQQTHIQKKQQDSTQ